MRHAFPLDHTPSQTRPTATVARAARSLLLGLAALSATWTLAVQPAAAALTATSAGAAPQAPAAVPLDPQALQMAPLATVAPGAAVVPPHQIFPTTAQPGTPVPGGRRQTLSFAELGALAPLQLRGVDSQSGVDFAVRADEVVTGAVLHLVYSYSPGLLPDLSQIKVLLNGEVAATLPVPREQGGVTLTRDIPIDPRYITEFDHLNLQLIGHYTRQCEAPTNSVLWATISNASSIELTYASLPVKADLAQLPLPFFDRRDVRRLELPFVFGVQPDARTLESAGIVASWFGALSGYRGALFPVSIGNLPATGNAVVLGTPDQLPAGIQAPPLNGPTIAVVQRSAPAQGSLLLVLGRDENELKIAARSLGLGGQTFSGTATTVSQLSDPVLRTPYDAPNWVPTSHPVTLGELAGTSSLTAVGYQADAIRINMRIPPDLFMWGTKGAPLDLRYRYTVRPKADRSSLDISLNNGFVTSIPIPPVSTLLQAVNQILPIYTPEATASAHYHLHIPPALLASRAQLAMHFFYDIPDTGECTGRLMPNVTGEIDPQSSIDLSDFAHYMALPDLAAFANSGFPYTRLADLSGTAVILPDAPDANDDSVYLFEMGHMGASTGYPVTAVTVGSASSVDQFADKDLIVIGAPGRQALLQRWAESMPFSGDNQALHFTLSELRHRFAYWWHGPHGLPHAAAPVSLSQVADDQDAFLVGFESPLKRLRSVVALISQPGQSQNDLMGALLDADVLPSVQGALDIVHGHTVTVVSNGNAYFVGHLPILDYLRWIFSLHPLLLTFGALIVSLVLAALFYSILRAIAARRVKS
jgi:cellulose synthase operon protein B